MKKLMIMLLLAAFSFGTYAAVFPQQDTTSRPQKHKTKPAGTKKNPTKTPKSKRDSTKRNPTDKDTTGRSTTPM